MNRMNNREHDDVLYLPPCKVFMVLGSRKRNERFLTEEEGETQEAESKGSSSGSAEEGGTQCSRYRCSRDRIERQEGWGETAKWDGERGIRSLNLQIVLWEEQGCYRYYHCHPPPNHLHLCIIIIFIMFYYEYKYYTIWNVFRWEIVFNFLWRASQVSFVFVSDVLS